MTYQENVAEVLDDQSFLTGQILDKSKRAGVWTRGLAVWLFFSIIFNILSIGAVSSIEGQAGADASSGFMGNLIGGLIGILINLFLGIRLYRLSKSFKSYAKSSDQNDLVSIFKHHFKFWRFAGIVCVLYVCLGLFVGFVAVAIGAAASSGIG